MPVNNATPFTNTYSIAVICSSKERGKSSSKDSLAERLFNSISSADPSSGSRSWTDMVSADGGVFLGGVWNFLLVIVIAFYMLIDGNRLFEWFLAFYSNSNQKKIRESSEAISEKIFAYMSGQVITSIAVGLFTFLILSSFSIPGAADNKYPARFRYTLARYIR